MKCGKIIIMLVFAVLVLMGIAGAWAGDAGAPAAGDDAGAVSDEVLAVADEEIINENGGGENIGERDDGSSTALWYKIQNSPGPVIKLENNYTIGNSYINIERSDIVIDGQGHTIDGQEKSVILNVVGSNVTIKNITFINTNNYMYVSTIYWRGAGGSVCDCSFVNCHVSDSCSGGAIYWSGAGGSVCDCSFVNCHADDFGGAIYWGGADGSVCDCSFVNCHADDFGGAIFWGGADGSVCDCSFVNCHADDFGGAIRLDEGVEVSGCIFVNNSAGNGGTVDLYYKDCTVRDCIFINNTGNYTIKNGWNYPYNIIVSGNIFLNNNPTEDIIHFDNPENFELGLNWFGNTADDYLIRPDVGVDIKAWLFLNATANPDSISLSDKSNITFKLFAYNSTSDNVSEYEGVQLNPAELLAITAVNGQTDKERVNIGQSVEFTPNDYGTCIIIASIEDVEYSVVFEIPKADSTLSVDAITYVYGGSGSTNVSFTGATGVEAEVINQPKAVVKVSGNKITVSGLNPGTYTLKVTTIADANHNPVTKTVEITVNKAKTQLTASAKAFKTTDKTKAYTVVLKDAKGLLIKNALVYLKVNGITYKATTNAKGIATFKMAKLTKAGNYRATVTFNGNAFYDKATKSVQITVKSVFKTVSKGSKDNAMVKKIQVALKKNGYYLRFAGHYLKVDGIFHIYTELAVKQFQKAKGLKVTGKVDETTAKRLKII